jgi:hypothetical protein
MNKRYHVAIRITSDTENCHHLSQKSKDFELENVVEEQCLFGGAAVDGMEMEGRKAVSPLQHKFKFESKYCASVPLPFVDNRERKFGVCCC